MPDRFSITTSTGSYSLNDTFRAVRYDIGGRDLTTLSRREGRTEIVRQGDGLNTPEGFILLGTVWTDDRTTSGYNTIRAEADAIKDAVLDCRELVMTNDVGDFVLEDVIGGPKPIFRPVDRWEIAAELEFWPIDGTIVFDPGGVPV